MAILPYKLIPTTGTMAPDQIPGRDKEITNLLFLLKSQSVSVEEMRRMGKSFLLLKTEYLCNHNLLSDDFAEDNFKAKYFSFQGKQDLGEVIDHLMKGLQEFKEWHQIDFVKTYNFIRGLFAVPEMEVGGAKFTVNLPEYKKSWKEIFFKTLEDVADAQAKISGKLILIFDELPIMLWEWYKEGKHGDAMELLDILRERRQMLEKNGVRFIYCGSIGIKVVLNTFRKQFGYTGEPTNEMAEFTLKPFSVEDTRFLCECYLLSGYTFQTEDIETTLQKVYEFTGGLPFYIAHIFTLIKIEFGGVFSPDTVVKAYHMIIEETNYHKAFNQLIDRLEIYYDKEEKNVMIAILNLLAKKEDWLDEDEIISGIEGDAELIKNSLYILYGDHYFSRKVSEGKRYYQFKYSIFKQWWKINKA